MTLGAPEIAVLGSWAATGLGLGLWIWGWAAERNPLKRQRLHDSGIVLVFAGILTRVVTKAEPLGVFDWLWLFVSPLFMAAALWRLTRTETPKP